MFLQIFDLNLSMEPSRQLGLGHLPGGDLAGDSGLDSGFSGHDDPNPLKFDNESGEGEGFGAYGRDICSVIFTECGEIVDGISGSSTGGGGACSIKHEFVDEKPVF